MTVPCSGPGLAAKCLTADKSTKTDDSMSATTSSDRLDALPVVANDRGESHTHSTNTTPAVAVSNSAAENSFPHPPSKQQNTSHFHHQQTFHQQQPHKNIVNSNVTTVPTTTNAATMTDTASAQPISSQSQVS